MASILHFTVEEIYRDYSRTGSVMLSDEEMERFKQYLRDTDGETSLYTSDLETCCPSIYRRIDEAALPLMEEMDAEMEAIGDVGTIDEKYHWASIASKSNCRNPYPIHLFHNHAEQTYHPS